MQNRLEQLKTIFIEEFEGATIEDAIKNAVSSLKMSKDELKIKILTEGQPGLFGLKGEKPAKIQVSPKFNKPEAVIKYFVIKLLDLIKEDISFIDVDIENKTINITIIFSNQTGLKKVSSKNVYTSILTLVENFVDQILPEYKVVINLKLSTHIPK
jgi:predicted RNA-binding protein Jag